MADLIQRELSELIRLELRDPRVGMVTLTSVDVSPDLSHAKVFFTILEKDKQVETTCKRRAEEMFGCDTRSWLAVPKTSDCPNTRRACFLLK